MTQWRKILAHRPESDLRKPSKGRLETPPFPQASCRQRNSSWYHFSRCWVQKFQSLDLRFILLMHLSIVKLWEGRSLRSLRQSWPAQSLAMPARGLSWLSAHEIPPLSLCPSQTPDLIPPPFLQRVQRLPAGPETTLANHQHTRWVPTMRRSPCLTLSAWPGTGSWRGQRPTVDPNTKRGGGGSQYNNS